MLWRPLDCAATQVFGFVNTSSHSTTSRGDTRVTFTVTVSELRVAACAMLRRTVLCNSVIFRDVLRNQRKYNNWQIFRHSLSFSLPIPQPHTKLVVKCLHSLDLIVFIVLLCRLGNSRQKLSVPTLSQSHLSQDPSSSLSFSNSCELTFRHLDPLINGSLFQVFQESS